MRLLLLFLVFFTASCFSATAQISVTNDQSVGWYIENHFLGEAVSISNITVNGLSSDSVIDRVGSFTSDGSYLPLSYGLVMSSGGVRQYQFGADDYVFGETSGLITSSPDYQDLDLESLSGESMNDVVSIEFDFVAQFSFIMYDYVFGSEEYPEYVFNFNDAFGFFISGPGIEGPHSSPLDFPNGAKNIALIPNTETAVTIDNVNNGDTDCSLGGPAGPCINCAYYIDNCDIEDYALDGMTTSLLAYSEVTPGETYHIKLAIGDAIDSSFDSVILLKESSLRSAPSLPTPTELHSYVSQPAVIVTNPVAATLMLSELPENMSQLYLYNLDGRLVLEQSLLGMSGQSIDVEALESGIYLLQLQAEDGRTLSQRIVKE